MVQTWGSRGIATAAATATATHGGMASQAAAFAVRDTTRHTVRVVPAGAGFDGARDSASTATTLPGDDGGAFGGQAPDSPPSPPSGNRGALRP